MPLHWEFDLLVKSSVCQHGRRRNVRVKDGPPLFLPTRWPTILLPCKNNAQTTETTQQTMPLPIKPNKLH
jgi:hypothetical protein